MSFQAERKLEYAKIGQWQKRHTPESANKSERHLDRAQREPGKAKNS